MLTRGRNNGVAVVAVDRPAYADSPILAAEAMDIAGQADFLCAELGEVWMGFGADAAGVVLIGHSIGAAIAATISSLEPDWPLLGLAISGVGLTTNPGDFERWQALPDIPLVETPDAVKDAVMFGPEGSFAPDMPEASRAASTTAPKAELLAITGAWHQVARDVLGRIQVPGSLSPGGARSAVGRQSGRSRRFRRRAVRRAAGRRTNGARDGPLHRFSPSRPGVPAPATRLRAGVRRALAHAGSTS